MKKLRIGYISKYFYPIRGGEENYMFNMALQSAKAGHEVHVFTGNKKGNQVIKEKESTYKGIHIHRCTFLFEGTHYLFCNPSLLLKVLKSDLDVIHVASFGMIWHDFVLILKKVFSQKTRFINTPHGPFMALKRYNILLKWFKKVYTVVQKIFLNWLYDIVLQDNTFQWRWITQYGIKKAKVKFVSVGIDKDLITKRIGISAIREFTIKHKISNKYVLSYLGRISEYKGVQDIIYVLQDLIRKFPDIVLLVMGRDDGYLRTLKKIAEQEGVKKYVRIIEDISEEDKFTALNISNIFIFPSEWEAFGIVLLEAMTQGNAIISTKTEGGKFLITEKVNGLLYDFGNKGQLKLHIESLLKNKQLVEKMTRENLKKVNQCSWDVIVKEQYLPIIESLTN
jgi:glycosyltransferase involved in cell wall biosynthesis